MTQKYNINANTIHSVGDGCTVIVGAERKELDTLLYQALETLQPNTSMHQALVSLQRDIANTGTPSSGTQRLIARASEALPKTDQAFGIVHKIVGTLVNLGWMSQ